MEVYKDILEQLLQSTRANIKVYIPQLDKYVLDLSYRIQIKNILANESISIEERLSQIGKIVH